VLTPRSSNRTGLFQACDSRRQGAHIEDSLLKPPTLIYTGHSLGSETPSRLNRGHMDAPSPDTPKKAKIGFLLLSAILVATTALLIFGWLAEEVLESDTARFDEVVRATVHRLASPNVTSLMLGFSFLGSVVMQLALTLVAIFLFLYFHRPRAALLLAITMAGAAGLDVVLKLAFHRARPAAFFGTSPNSYSFPSGHALGSLCFYGALAVILSARTPRRSTRACIWAVALVLIGMIGLSRIYLGVHYPSDVIAGYSAAVVWVAAVGFSDRILKFRTS
jgi:undecaprenyl-diphosphatase